MSCSRETCSATAGVASIHRPRLPARAINAVREAFMIAKSAPSLVLYLQPVGADIDLQALGFLLGLIEIVAEHADGRDQRRDDEIQDVAVAGHPLAPS